MGSWNGTCGLTNLPILAGDDVVVTPLVKNNRVDSMCYTTPFYGPILMPFYGKYNGYGAAEDCYGFGLNYVLNLIKSNLVEVEAGENRYHDIPVTKADFTEEVFWEAIHENRLAVQHHTGPREVGMVMMHKKVINNLKENYGFSSYVKVGNNYETVKYKFADVLRDLQYVIKAAKKPKDKVLLIELFSNPILNLFNEKDRETNLAVVWLGQDLEYRYPMMQFNITVFRLIKAKEFDVLEEFLTEHLTAKFIDSFMDATRKIWIPQGGAGSQRGGLNPYKLLMNATQEIITMREKEDEELGYESDED